MPIVYVHGVSVRMEHDYYAPSEKTRESLMRSILLPGFAPANSKIFNPYWGNLAASLAWDGKSLPTGTDEHLGPADVLVQKVAEEAMIEVGSVDPERLLPTLARKKGLGRAIDVLWPAAAVGQKPADADAFGQAGAVAAKLAEENDHPEWLDEVADNAAFTERLLQEIKKKSAPAAARADEALGLQDWWNSTVEGAKKLATSAAAAVTNPAVRAVRPALNEKITYFVGDVFCYLRSREKNKENCPIVKVVGTAIRGAAALRKADDPLVVIGHSMGGNICYDLLTSYLKDVECDLFLTVGSQVGLFEELKLFNSSDTGIKHPKQVKRPANVKRWINVFDLADVFSYSGTAMFDGIEEYDFSSGETVVTAHGAYLLQPRFYQRLKARLKP